MIGPHAASFLVCGGRCQQLRDVMSLRLLGLVCTATIEKGVCMRLAVRL